MEHEEKAKELADLLMENKDIIAGRFYKESSEIRAKRYVPGNMKQPLTVKGWCGKAALPLDGRISVGQLGLYAERVSRDIALLLNADHSLRHKELLSIVFNRHAGGSTFTTGPLSIWFCSTDMSAHAAPGVMAHEVVHFYQYFLNKCLWGFKPLKEGFARGVEKKLVRAYADETGIPQYMAATRARLKQDIDSLFNCARFNRPLPEGGHWGSAAFLLAEARHGDGFYTEMFHSDEPYGMLVKMLGQN